jgi:hypothetical protein
MVKYHPIQQSPRHVAQGSTPTEPSETQHSSQIEGTGIQQIIILAQIKIYWSRFNLLTDSI